MLEGKIKACLALATFKGSNLPAIKADGTNTNTILLTFECNVDTSKSNFHSYRCIDFMTSKGLVGSVRMDFGLFPFLAQHSD